MDANGEPYLKSMETGILFTFVSADGVKTDGCNAFLKYYKKKAYFLLLMMLM
jgi:hypothetical protein